MCYNKTLLNDSVETEKIVIKFGISYTYKVIDKTRKTVVLLNLSCGCDI